jgi:hypothetical protein
VIQIANKEITQSTLIRVTFAKSASGFSPRLRSRRLHCRQNLLCMPFRLHFGEDLCDFAVLIDQERGPLDSDRLLAVHILLFEDAERFTHFFVFIGEERVRKAIFIFEVLEGFDRVFRNAQHDRAGTLQLGKLIAKAASFDGSAGCIGFRKEEEHDRFAAEILETHRVAVLVGHSDLRSFISDFHEGQFLSIQRSTFISQAFRFRFGRIDSGGAQFVCATSSCVCAE